MGMKNSELYLPERCVGVPQLGSDIIEWAEHNHLLLDELVERLLFVANNPLISLTVSAGTKKNFKWICGHGYAVNGIDDIGPRRQYRGMIITKAPSVQDSNFGRYLSDSVGVRLRSEINSMVSDIGSYIYVTGVMKTIPLQARKWKKSWESQQKSLLFMEILLTRPKHVMILGREVGNLFFGTSFKVESYEGRWKSYTIDMRQNTEEEITEENQFTFNIIPCMNPGLLEYEQTEENIHRLRRVTSEFVSKVSSSENNVELITKAVEYPVIRSLSQLDSVLDEITTEAVSKFVGVDAEWQGRHPQDHDSYLRCVQFGWKPGKACTLHLTNINGEYDLVDDAGRSGKAIQQKAFDMIRERFIRNEMRVSGFFFQADYEWLAFHGLDLMECFKAAPHYTQVKHSGGFALELAVNAYDELMKNDLESVRVRFTDVHDYYSGFEAYKKARSSERKNNPHFAHLFNNGYGWIPDEYLYPYAAADADVTLRATLRFMDLLESDRFGIPLWLPYWISHRAAPTLCEIMRSGMPVSLRRCAELAIIYENKMQELRRELDRAFCWENFPIDTWQQLNSVLYGARYSGYVDSTTGNRINRRPPGSRSLCLEPILSNDKSPIPWEQVRSLGEESIKNPSSSLKVLNILHRSSKVKARRFDENGNTEVVEIDPPRELKLIADAKMIRQVQKNFLGKVHKVVDSNGNISFEFDGGYPRVVSDDSYIRCFMSATKETGRWSAANPNLHNSPNKTEADYKKILGDKYPGNIRTLVDVPEGYVLVESDYASAELFVLAIASGDPVLWDHCSRNLLSEDDPRFVDPHARLCVESFHLPCTPLKSGLASIGKEYMRNVAKCISEDEYLWTDLGPVRVKLLAEHVGIGLGNCDKDLSDSSISVKSVCGFTELIAGSYTGVKPCVEVATHIGNSVTTTADHRHLVTTMSGDILFKDASDILPGEQLWLQMESGCQTSMGELPKFVYDFVYKFFNRDLSSDKNGDLSDEVIFLIGLLYASSLVVRGFYDGYSCESDTKTVIKLSQQSLNLSSLVVDTFNRLFKVGNFADNKIGNFEKITINSVGFGGELREFVKSWELVPDIVLMWPERKRISYVYGLLAVLSKGCRQSVKLVVNDRESASFQMLMQTLGYLVKVEDRQGFSHITPFCSGSVDLFHMVGSLFSVRAPRAVPRSAIDKPIQQIPYFLYRIGLSYGIKLDHQNYCESAEHVLSVVEELRQRIGSSLKESDETTLRNIEFFVSSSMVPMTVVSVKAVGNKNVYDFQTTDEQGRLLVVNGIATHNSVIYGWAYGRQAPAIVLNAKETGVKLDLSEAEELIKKLSTDYVAASMYLEEAASRVDHGFLVTPMGRVRRFPSTTDKKKLSEYRREAKNATVQGGVADIVNLAAGNLWNERIARGMRFHIILQMHDAFYFLCPYSEVMELCNEVIPKAMCKDIPIRPFNLDGSFSDNNEPKIMGYNVSVSFGWKKKMSKENLISELQLCGIDLLSIKRIEL